MIQRLCSRCHSVLQLEDEGALVFCWSCGAPRVLLSEELRTHAEQQSQALEEPAATPTPFVVDPSVVIWKSMIRTAAAVAGVFSFLVLVLPPLALLVPAIVLAVYAARHRETLVTAALGTRVGLICGLFTAGFTSVLGVAALLISRFSTHQMGEFDQTFNATVLRYKAQVVAEQGAAAGAVFNQFSIPEFRAGLVLGGLCLFLVLLLLFSAAGGAFAGFIRSRTRAR